MFTLTEIQKTIHRLYSGDTDYPQVGSEDWSFRLGLINDAIRKWAYESGVYWRELFTNLSNASDGDKTASSSQAVYSTPSNFVNISSWLTITDNNNSTTYYSMVKNNDVLKILSSNSSAHFFYLTGNPGSGYKININNPKNGTINYSYYKKATDLSSANDIPEMSKPYYIVYEALAILYELDNRNDLASKYLQLAKNILDEMIVQNETLPFNTPDKIDDLDYQLGGGIFGV